MHRAQEQVRAFHEVMGQPVGDSPAIRDARLRAALILEEAIETACALVGSKNALAILETFHGRVQDAIGRPGNPGSEPDLAEAIDGMCDVLYVVYGTAVACGVDIESFFDEVHRSNLEKATGEVREDGKRLKPPGWKPPRIREMLAELQK